jgi:threonine dehydrogenase-like Zn-dependent dehydrogenase
MKAIVFDKSIARYAALKLLGGKRAAKAATGRLPGLCPASLRDIDRKALPSSEWIRVRPSLTGICGSDLSVICSKGSPYFSPLTSTPFVFGHETVGVVTEIGEGVSDCEYKLDLPALATGQRVILEPALGCRVRGIEPLCPACAHEHIGLCRNVTRGAISPGIQTGYCRDTGGSWSEEFVAHRTQLFPVPETMSDRAAVLAEPLACVLHGVLRATPTDDQTALVVGCGSIGLLAIASLRACGTKARIVAVAKYPHQKAHAANLGADVVIDPARGRVGYEEWAKVLGAELHQPEIGKPTVLGGADVTYDCIGSSQSIDDTIRFTVAGGQMVLIGMPGIPSNIDWTSLWHNELSLHAAYAYGLEDVAGTPFATGGPRHTCALAIEMIEEWSDRLTPLVGQPFDLEDYKSAFRTALFAGESGSVKTVFRIA